MSRDPVDVVTEMRAIELREMLWQAVDQVPGWFYRAAALLEEIEASVLPPLAIERLRELDRLKRAAEQMESVSCPSD